MGTVSTLEETARGLGVSIEYLRSCPIWIQEGRAATPEEFTAWSRSQKGGCSEYIAAYPLSHYHGACVRYLQFGRRPCGVPFVSKVTCTTGGPREGKEHHVSWKDFRKNFDRLGRTDEQRLATVRERNLTSRVGVPRKAPSRAPGARKAGTAPINCICYTCDICGSTFESARTRTGPLHCASCAGELRKEGKGPLQQLKRGS